MVWSASTPSIRVWMSIPIATFSPLGSSSPPRIVASSASGTAGGSSPGPAAPASAAAISKAIGMSELSQLRAGQRQLRALQRIGGQERAAVRRADQVGGHVEMRLADRVAAAQHEEHAVPLFREPADGLAPQPERGVAEQQR